MNKLPTPIDGAILYENDYLYVCLANFPITKGHTVVVWKETVPDLQLLERGDYEHLMDIVDQTRNALIKALDVEKVYLMYMDEVSQVHWHLIPRYDEAGFNILNHKPSELTDTSIANTIKQNWTSLK